MIHRCPSSREPFPLQGQAFGISSASGHDFANLAVYAQGTHGTQRKLAISEPGDIYELEADRVAERVVRTPLFSAGREAGFSGLLSRAPVFIQRQADDDSATPAAAPAGPADTSTPALLVEDSVIDLAPGQMAKKAFLSQLRPAVDSAVLAAIGGGAEQTADAAQVLDSRFSYARTRDARLIESEIQQSSPDAANATSATDYIPIIADQAGSAAQAWAGGSASAAAGGGASAEEAGPAGGEESGPSSAGVSFKAREGGPRDPGSLQAVQARLGQGQGIDGGVRARMESAFGMSFSRVRVHTGGSAAELATEFNARAFTLGNHIAFGSGEYRPGTLVGDALLPHELAHVVQQASSEPSSPGSSPYEVLESDADQSAATVVAGLFGLAGRLFGAPGAGPRLKSGLRLQRCSGKTKGTTNYRFLAKSGFDVCTFCACSGEDTSCGAKLIGHGPERTCPPGRRVTWEEGDFGCTIKTETDLTEDPCPKSTRVCI
jgi:hypothetical protein